MAHKSFGERLRAERKKRGVSAEDLGRACGISRSFIVLIERGHRLPGKKILPKIAQALGLSTADVLNWYLEEIANKLRKSLNV